MATLGFPIMKEDEVVDFLKKVIMESTNGTIIISDLKKLDVSCNTVRECPVSVISIFKARH